MRCLLIITLLALNGVVLGQSWQLMWEDHFNDATVFNERWHIYNQAYAEDNNIFLDDNVNLNTTSGILEITTKREATAILCTGNDYGDQVWGSVPACDYHTYYPFSSGWVSLKGNYNVQYGKIEARIKMSDSRKKVRFNWRIKYSIYFI